MAMSHAQNKPVSKDDGHNADLDKFKPDGHLDHDRVTSEHMKHEDELGAGVCFPDIVNDISPPSPLSQQHAIGDQHDPDIVRSSSTSSDEKSGEAVLGVVMNKSHIKLSSAALSVSSFSSSSSSSHTADSDGKLKTSTISSFSSSENDDLAPLVSPAKNHSSLKVQRGKKAGPKGPTFVMNKSFVTQVSENDDNEVFTTETSSAVHSYHRPMDPSPHDRRSTLSDSNLSEKGQKARQSYRSSGYGTGSGESGQGGSTTKTSVQLSQDLVAVQKSHGSVDAASTANPEILTQPGSVPKSKSCIENDFAPPVSRKSTAVAAQGQQRLDVQAKTESHALSQHFKEPQEDPCHKSHSVISGVPKGEKPSGFKENSIVDSQAHAHANASTMQGPEQQDQHQAETMQVLHPIGHAAGFSNSNLPPSLQQHSSASLTHPSQMSSSSSYVLSSSVEARLSLINGPSPGSILKRHVLQSGSGTPDNSRESPSYRLDEFLPKNEPASKHHDDLKLQQQSLPKFELLSIDPSVAESTRSLLSSFGYSQNPELLRKLRRNSRCREVHCDDAECVEMRTELQVLQRAIEEGMDLNPSQEDLLLNMFDHSENCNRPKCPFRWCGFIRLANQHLPQTLDDIIKIMKQRLQNFVDYCPLSHMCTDLSSVSAGSISCITVDGYMKLSPTLDLETVPLPGRDWTGICMIGQSSASMLAMPHQNDQFDPKYWVIKTVPTSDSVSQWELYSKLAQVKHDSITEFLWAASLKEDKSLIVCTLYEGYSLHESLQALAPDHLEPGLILNIMYQMTNATRKLHSLGIVFLNWTSTSILVARQTNSGPLVRMNNFSCSALLKHDDGKCGYDGGDLYLSLSPHLMSPELREEESTVNFPSDVWGLGCFLYELVTGQPVWHEDRHLPDEILINKMKETPFPEPPRIYPELRSVFTECWKINPWQRCKVTDIEDLLVSAFQPHLRP